jgi:hypothetical protein
VLSFGDILDGDHVERPFANSLTATREGFSNFQHMDNDASLIAYGMWFEAGKREGDQTWSFTEDGDHEKTKGGEFIWGAFGIGVDFEKFFFFLLCLAKAYILLQIARACRDFLAGET